jgi:hypothetical protein
MDLQFHAQFLLDASICIYYMPSSFGVSAVLLYPTDLFFFYVSFSLLTSRLLTKSSRSPALLSMTAVWARGMNMYASLSFRFGF